MRIARAAAITIAIVFVVNAIISLGSGIPLLVPLIVSVVPTLFGIVIGALVYCILAPTEQRRYLRIVSSLLSGLVAAGLNWLVVSRSMRGVSSLGDPFHAIAVVAMVYTCVIAGVVGIIFGAGIGQTDRNREPQE